MGAQKMARISPAASNLIALVAQSPSMPEERVAQLLDYLQIDQGQRALVGRVVEAIREHALHPEAHDSTVPQDEVAEDIAQAYMQWVKENALHNETGCTPAKIG
jgi:hypothetical protein